MTGRRVTLHWLVCFVVAACGGGRTVSAPPVSAPAASAPAVAASASAPSPADDSALALHRSAIVIDTHNDVTQRLVVQGVDLSQRLPEGHTDLPRLRKGGVDAEFLSVFVLPN